MSDSHYIDVVIFAMIAVFIGLRLRSVLGRRTGNERPPPSGLFPGRSLFNPTPKNQPPAPIIEGTAQPVPATPAGETGAAAGLAQIQAIDPSITAEAFLGGARAAFGMILSAFARGDETALRPLLSDEVFQNFTGVIRARREASETCENQVVGIDSAEVAEAEVAGKYARITVRFVSQQIIVVKNAQGAVVEGDPAKTVHVTDLWTFARDPRARDPNWTLVATRSQDE